MLHCADRTFYVGHTDDLETRIGQHETGHFKGQTSGRLPVHLVWSDEFPTRYEALQMERRLKGWSKLKKLALIRGDWAAISALARNAQEKEGTSTSSARTVWEGVAKSRFLHPHPSNLPSTPFSLESIVRRSGPAWQLNFRLCGPSDLLRVPDRLPPERHDELWRHTCFELFIGLEGGEDYLEFNYSPSTRWAAYRFESYRHGMSELHVDAPQIRVISGPRQLTLKTELTLPKAFNPSRIGLSAVIEEASGRKSYWALRHPPGDTPDFHHPDCFAIELPPASAS